MKYSLPTTFTITDLTNVLSKKSKLTAAGGDGVKYDMIKALSLQSLENFLIAMNKCWHKNEILSSWRRIKIIQILE